MCGRQEGIATVSEAVAKGLAAVGEAGPPRGRSGPESRHSLKASKAGQMATVSEGVAPEEKIAVGETAFCNRQTTYREEG